MYTQKELAIQKLKLLITLYRALKNTQPDKLTFENISKELSFVPQNILNTQTILDIHLLSLFNTPNESEAFWSAKLDLFERNIKSIKNQLEQSLKLTDLISEANERLQIAKNKLTDNLKLFERCQFEHNELKVKKDKLFFRLNNIPQTPYEQYEETLSIALEFENLAFESFNLLKSEQITEIDRLHRKLIFSFKVSREIYCQLSIYMKLNSFSLAPPDFSKITELNKINLVISQDKSGEKYINIYNELNNILISMLIHQQNLKDIIPLDRIELRTKIESHIGILIKYDLLREILPQLLLKQDLINLQNTAIIARSLISPRTSIKTIIGNIRPLKDEILEFDQLYQNILPKLANVRRTAPANAPIILALNKLENISTSASSQEELIQLKLKYVALWNLARQYLPEDKISFYQQIFQLKLHELETQEQILNNCLENNGENTLIPTLTVVQENIRQSTEEFFHISNDIFNSCQLNLIAMQERALKDFIIKYKTLNLFLMSSSTFSELAKFIFSDTLLVRWYFNALDFENVKKRGQQFLYLRGCNTLEKCDEEIKSLKTAIHFLEENIKKAINPDIQFIINEYLKLESNLNNTDSTELKFPFTNKLKQRFQDLNLFIIIKNYRSNLDNKLEYYSYHPEFQALKEELECLNHAVDICRGERLPLDLKAEMEKVEYPDRQQDQNFDEATKLVEFKFNKEYKRITYINSLVHDTVDSSFLQNLHADLLNGIRDKIYSMKNPTLSSQANHFDTLKNSQINQEPSSLAKHSDTHTKVTRRLTKTLEKNESYEYQNLIAYDHTKQKTKQPSSRDRKNDSSFFYTEETPNLNPKPFVDQYAMRLINEPPMAPNKHRRTAEPDEEISVHSRDPNHVVIEATQEEDAGFQNMPSFESFRKFRNYPRNESGDERGDDNQFNLRK